MSAALLWADEPLYDRRRYPFLMEDYLYAVRLGLITHDPSDWNSWLLGYRDGEEIGLRVARRSRRRRSH